MAIVTVRVNGREYQVACDDGQEKHLFELSQEIDRKVRGFAGHLPNASEEMLMLLATLMVADEAHELKSNVRNLNQQLDEMYSQHEAQAAARMDELEMAISEALVEVAERIEQIAERL